MSATLPNYVRILADLRASGELPDGAFVVNVRHDAWCAIFSGHPCDCNCDIEVNRVGPRREAAEGTDQ